MRAVVFDLDGTLIDTEHVFDAAARRVLAGHGLELDADFMASIMGLPGRDVLPLFRDRFGLTHTLDELAVEFPDLVLDVRYNGGGLLYVQPVYVQSTEGTRFPLLRKVLVSFGDEIGFADTLDEALDQVFGGDSGANAGDADGGVETEVPDQPADGETADPGTTDPGTEPPTSAQCPLDWA